LVRRVTAKWYIVVITLFSFIAISIIIINPRLIKCESFQHGEFSSNYFYGGFQDYKFFSQERINVTWQIRRGWINISKFVSDGCSKLIGGLSEISFIFLTNQQSMCGEDGKKSRNNSNRPFWIITEEIFHYMPLFLFFIAL